MSRTNVTKVSKKDLFPHGGSSSYNRDEDTYEITVPYHASTDTILHEISHAELGHSTERSSGLDMVREEIDADLLTSERMGKEGISLNKLKGLATGLMRDYNYSAGSILTAITDYMGKIGIPLDYKDKSELWDYVKKLDRLV